MYCYFFNQNKEFSSSYFLYNHSSSNGLEDTDDSLVWRISSVDIVAIYDVDFVVKNLPAGTDGMLDAW